MARAPRLERLEARISTKQKALFERAASLSGRTLTDFVVSSVEEAAEEVIKRHEVIVLSPRDSVHFVEALLDPPAPNEALRAAAGRHREVFSE